MRGHPRARIQCELHRAERWVVERTIPTGGRLGDRRRGHWGPGDYRVRSDEPLCAVLRGLDGQHYRRVWKRRRQFQRGRGPHRHAHEFQWDLHRYVHDFEAINRRRAQPHPRIPPVHRAGCDWSGRTLLLVSEEGAKEGRRGVREPPGGQPSERMVVPNVSLPKNGENLMTEPMEVSTKASGRRVADGLYGK